MKKQLAAITICMIMMLIGVQTVFGLPARMETQSSQVTTSAPATTTTTGVVTDETGKPVLTSEQETAVVVITIIAALGLIWSVIEKARKKKKSPLRKDV